MPVATLPAAAAVTELALYLLDLKRRHEAGDMTDQEISAAYIALGVRREDTKNIWADAKTQGGYI